MGTSRRILVVDDDQTILNLVKLTLEHEGYEVILAQDGQIALDRYRSDQIDLAIVDIAMPVMDGYEVIAEMKKLRSQEKHVPIVILSAHDQEVMRDYASELGVDAYLTKPMTAKQLKTHVERLIGEAHSTP
jgi:two-component system alkaline phosphatase synthesis response regulator PhoP